MKDNLLVKHKLLIFLGFLLVVKLGVLPLLEWQSLKIDELNAKSRQLAKLDMLTEKRIIFKEKLHKLGVIFKRNGAFLYADNANTKLHIQQDIEQIFDREGLDLKGFNWVSDSGESPENIRVLRATVVFGGALVSMIEVFWELAAKPELIRVVESSQQLRSTPSGELGKMATDGRVTLEFFSSNSYAIFNERDAVMLSE